MLFLFWLLQGQDLPTTKNVLHITVTELVTIRSIT